MADQYLDQLKDRARQLGQFVDWPMPERQQSRAGVVAAVSGPERFTDKLVRATKAAAARRLERPPAIAATATNDDSFGGKIADAVRARTAHRSRATTVKEHEEQAAKQRARYRKPVRRQRTKSE